MSAWDTSWWLEWQLSHPFLCPSCPEERLGIYWDLISFFHSSAELVPDLPQCVLLRVSVNTAWGTLASFVWAKPPISCNSGKGSAQGRVESLFTVKDLTRQKNGKILLQKVACLFHGCRDRFNRLKTTALDWKCNSGSKNAFCNPFV